MHLNRPTDQAGSAELVRVLTDGTVQTLRSGCAVGFLDVYCSSGTRPLPDGHYRVVAHLQGPGTRWRFDGTVLDTTVRSTLTPAPTLLPPRLNSATVATAYFQGNSPAGSTVQLLVTDRNGRPVQTTTTSATGQWAAELDLQGLADGALDVVATRPDAPDALPAHVRVVKDTRPPTAPAVQLTSGAGNTSTWSALLPDVSSYALLAAHDHLGEGVSGTGVGRAGTARSTGSVSVSSLADGPIALTLRVLDVSGNETDVPAGTVTKADVPSIEDAYARYRAAGLDLGSPLGPVQERDCGAVVGCRHSIRSRAYTGGEIWSAEGVGTFEVQGPIAQRWHATGGVDGPFAMPTADEAAAGPLGRVSAFQGGDLLWSQATGVQPLTGAYLTGYLAGSRAALGVPTGLPRAAAVSAVQTDRTATVQPFTGGRVYVSQAGPQAVWGEVSRELTAVGGEGAYGLPRTGELPLAGGVEVDFDAGRVYWSPASGAHEMHGRLGDYYAQGGTAQSGGFPVADEETVPGSLVGARQSRLQAATLVWSPTTSVAAVHGEIGRLYEEQAALLGAPTFSETAQFEGEPPREQPFLGGRAYWSPWTGVHEVHGEILRAYRPDGVFDNPYLGLPTSDEHADGAWRRNDFEHGYIRWSPAAGAVITYAR